MSNTERKIKLQKLDNMQKNGVIVVFDVFQLLKPRCVKMQMILVFYIINELLMY